jgi:hypothetical protein
MTREPEKLLDENDELGMVEAAYAPQSEVPSDRYVEDKNYDEALSDLDPDKLGHH